MRVKALAERILKQLSHDKRTIGLMFIVPLLLLTLIYYIFEGTDDSIKVGVVHPSEALVDAMRANEDINIVDYDSWDTAADALKDNALVAIMDMADFRIMVNGSAGAKASAAERMLTGLIDNINREIESRQALAAKLSQLLDRLAVPLPQRPELLASILGDADNEILDNSAGNAETASDLIRYEVEYLDGIKDIRNFDLFGSTLMGFLTFFFVFLVAGMAFLKERKSGTLEKLISTPIRRWEIVLGYVCGFGAITALQSAVISLFIVKVLGIMIHGSIWYVLLIMFLTAVCALTLGMLLSTAANSEFQMMQFIPVVVIPQLFFSGLFDLSEGWMLFGKILPLTYIADALDKILFAGAGIDGFYIDALILVGFSTVFMGLNVLLLKRCRRI
jgi:ABC-2 type transport system permease protein